MLSAPMDAGSAAMTTITRPENRQRSDAATWAATLPAGFRSEAFAEDLDAPAEAPACAPQGPWQLSRWLAMSALALSVLPDLAPR
jgi:hypothetical protein